MQGMRPPGSSVRDSGVVQERQKTETVQALQGQFRTVAQALAWASAVLSGSPHKVANYLPASSRATGESMTDLDRRAQAAMILSHVAALPVDEMAYIVATYCTGEDMIVAVNRLKAFARIAVGQDSLTDALVVRYVSASRRIRATPLRAIAEVCGVTRKTARVREGKVRAFMGGLWADAEERLDRRWTLSGLISP